MSQWQSYPQSVIDCSAADQCIGAGIYSQDGNVYATAGSMPQFQPADVKRAVDYVKNELYKTGAGLDLGIMKFTFIRKIDDGTETHIFKRKPVDENEDLKDPDKYQFFIQLAKTTTMIGIFKGGAQGNHTTGLARMNSLVEYLKSVNM